MDFLDLLDSLAQGYNTDPHTIMRRWTWREMLIYSQALKRRFDRREASRNQDEARSAAERNAAAYDNGLA